jgi:RNA polymerase sigma factor (sigma-70 family)
MTTPDSNESDTWAAGLMVRYCQGDDAAFAELYRRVAPRLVAYVTSLVRDPATAEDIVQGTMLKVHLSQQLFRQGADPVPWIYRIAYRTLIDEIRRRSRQRRIRDEIAAAAPPAVEEPAALAEERSPAPEQKAMLAAVQAAVHELPAVQKEAIKLTKLDGHTYAEAAALCGASIGTLKVRTYRGVMALRRRVHRARLQAA